MQLTILTLTSALLALCFAGTAARAQCPGGQCYAPSYGAAQPRYVQQYAPSYGAAPRHAFGNGGACCQPRMICNGRSCRPVR
jgi:hypothetical protein